MKYNAKMGVLVNTRFIKAVNDIQLVIQKKKCLVEHTRNYQQEHPLLVWMLFK